MVEVPVNRGLTHGHPPTDPNDRQRMIGYETFQRSERHAKLDGGLDAGKRCHAVTVPPDRHPAARD